jgi:hypothetical protein
MAAGALEAATMPASITSCGSAEAIAPGMARPRKRRIGASNATLSGLACPRACVPKTAS